MCQAPQSDTWPCFYSDSENDAGKSSGLQHTRFRHITHLSTRHNLAHRSVAAAVNIHAAWS